MRQVVFTTALTVLVLIPCVRPLSAADPPVGCSLLTQAQIGAVIGGAVGPGEAIVIPTSCQWVGQQGKRVTVTQDRPRAGKTPVQQFEEGKKGMIGVTIEPVTGAGDDAYYIFYTGQNRMGCGLVVKKGAAAFEIRVYGFDLDKAKPVAKTLAQEVAAKF